MEMVLKPVHAGDILFEEFMKPCNVTAYKLSKMTGMSQTQIGRIIKGKRSITVDTALRLAQVFNTSPEFWLNIQNRYDIDNMKMEINNPAANVGAQCSMFRTVCSQSVRKFRQSRNLTG